MVEPVSTTIVVVKCFCWVCTILGTGYCAKKAHDAYSKGQKTKRERYSLKGKSIEAAHEDNKKAQAEIDELKKKYEDQERENKRIEEELRNAKNKANDSDLNEEERAKWRRKVADLEDELKKGKQKSRSFLDLIKGLGDRIKNNSKTISDSASNPDDKHWIWEFLTLENILIMGACYALYKILKDDDK